MKNFRDLIVWKKAHEFVLACYKSTKTFPKEELFNLTSQLRRASTSIPTNIAEGCGRFTQQDFARFLQIALGSATEVEYLLFLALELGYLTVKEYKQLDGQINQVKAILITLVTKVRKESPRKGRYR